MRLAWLPAVPGFSSLLELNLRTYVSCGGKRGIFFLSMHANNRLAIGVARLEQAYLASDGDLPTVYRALVAAPEAWAADTAKFRTPWDWTVASLRATGQTRLPGRQAAAGLLQQLGQPIWRPGSPAGWGDTAPDWAGPGALMTRVEVAQQFASRIGDAVDARQLSATVLPDAGAETRQAIALSARDGPRFEHGPTRFGRGDCSPNQRITWHGGSRIASTARSPGTSFMDVDATPFAD